MEDILHHLTLLKPCKEEDKLPMNWCKISSINNSHGKSTISRWMNFRVSWKKSLLRYIPTVFFLPKRPPTGNYQQECVFLYKLLDHDNNKLLNFEFGSGLKSHRYPRYSSKISRDLWKLQTKKMHMIHCCERFRCLWKTEKPYLFGKKHQNIQKQHGFVTNRREQSRLAVPQFPNFGNSNQIGCLIFSLGEVVGFGFEVPPTGVLSVQSGVDGAFAQSQNNIYWLPNREITVNPFPENPEKNMGAFLGVDPFRNYAREP